jgi:glucose-6-phosphate dehydrogenase assembly protein OpcA
MATTYKVLGQVAPSATTDTTLYTVPADKQTVVSTIVVANRAATTSFYRIAIRPSGASIANQHYIAYDVVVGGNDSTTLTLGITITTTDVLTIYSSSTNLTFAAFGSEIDL